MANAHMLLTPSADAYAAADSWWVGKARAGFTAAAWQEWARRMRRTRFAHVACTSGPMAPSTQDLWRAKKAIKAQK